MAVKAERCQNGTNKVNKLKVLKIKNKISVLKLLV
jgi:hypothetical protein